MTAAPVENELENELDDLVKAVLAHPGLHNKTAIGLVTDVLGATDWVTGPGDDAAAVDIPGALGTKVVACGEALFPPFVKADPFGAGFAAVLTNLNDVAATGGVPLGVVDTIVAGEDDARAALEGMRHACELYDVPILGGHLTPHDGPPAMSAFAVGTTRNVLSVTHVAVGQSLLVACALEGEMRTDFPFFRSFEARGTRCAGDLRVLADVAESGACVAAKDISMAGLVGSLVMLLEYSGLGVTVDLDALPVPPGVEPAAWLNCFPSFGFLLCAEPGREQDCVAAFAARGLACAVVGRIRETADVSLSRGGHTREVLGTAGSPVTRLDRGGRPVTTTQRTRTVDAVWEEGMRCTVTAGQFTLVADEPESAGGTDLGPQPTDLLLAALASCFAMAVAYSARKRGVVLTDLTVAATGVYNGPGFDDLRVAVTSGHEPAELARLVSAAERLCYVSNTFRNHPEISVEVTPPR